MALIKPIDQAGSGHVCEYWRITKMAVDHTAGTVTATLSGYRDEAARRQGLNPLLHVAGVWKAADLEVRDLHYLTTADLYWAFRHQADDRLFADAGDDLPRPPPLPVQLEAGQVEDATAGVG